MSERVCPNCSGTGRIRKSEDVEISGRRIHVIPVIRYRLGSAIDDGDAEDLGERCWRVEDHRGEMHFGATLLEAAERSLQRG